MKQAIDLKSMRYKMLYKEPFILLYTQFSKLGLDYYLCPGEENGCSARDLVKNESYKSRQFAFK